MKKFIAILSMFLFTFTSSISGIRGEFKEENRILILDYCNHDEQIRRAKELNINIDFIDLNYHQHYLT